MARMARRWSSAAPPATRSGSTSSRQGRGRRRRARGRGWRRSTISCDEHPEHRRSAHLRSRERYLVPRLLATTTSAPKSYARALPERPQVPALPAVLGRREDRISTEAVLADGPDAIRIGGAQELRVRWRLRTGPGHAPVVRREETARRLRAARAAVQAEPAARRGREQRRGEMPEEAGRVALRIAEALPGLAAVARAPELVALAGARGAGGAVAREEPGQVGRRRVELREPRAPRRAERVRPRRAAVARRAHLDLLGGRMRRDPAARGARESHRADVAGEDGRPGLARVGGAAQLRRTPRRGAGQRDLDPRAVAVDRLQRDHRLAGDGVGRDRERLLPGYAAVGRAKHDAAAGLRAGGSGLLTRD